MIYHKLIFKLLVIILWISLAFAQDPFTKVPDILPFQTLQGKFVKITARNAVADTVKSTFYFNSTPYMYLETQHPFHQIMTILENKTTIYYPRRQLAYVLSSERPPLLPVISYLIGYFRSDEGLANLGLNLKDQIFKGDTLITIWVSPDPQKNIGSYQLEQVNEKTIQLTYTSPDTSIINMLYFKDLTSIDNVTLPMTIISEKTSPRYSSREVIYLSDIKINLPIPPAYLNFKLPDGIKVVEKRW